MNQSPQLNFILISLYIYILPAVDDFEVDIPMAVRYETDHVKMNKELCLMRGFDLFGSPFGRLVFQAASMSTKLTSIRVIEGYLAQQMRGEYIIFIYSWLF